MPAIRLHMLLEPEMFMDGLRLNFEVQQGRQRFKWQRYMPMSDLVADSFLDLVWRELHDHMRDTIREYQRERASAEKMREQS